MTTLVWHYNRKILGDALHTVGLKEGDIVFSHVGLGMLGYPSEGRSLLTACQVVLGAFQDVLGPTGTIVVPTFTLSFCRGEDYDPDHTPSRSGPFTEFLRTQPGVKRSRDPIMSVAVMGPASQDLIEELPSNCFGKGSIYDRLVRFGAIICNIGVGFRYTNFVHHVETVVGVPYRYDKVFRGQIIQGGVRQTVDAIYHVRALVPNTEPAFSRLEREARARGLCRSAIAGRGEVIGVRCTELFDLCSELLDRDRWCLVEGPPCAVVPEPLDPVEA